MTMFNEDEKYFCLSGDIPVGGPSTWHVVNWDQRRVVSVTMDGEQDDDALAIENYSRHSEELSPEVYRIYVSETGEIIRKYIDAKYDMNYCIHYPLSLPHHRLRSLCSVLPILGRRSFTRRYSDSTARRA